MLMDTGGNCGSQSSTLIIRGIALNQVTFHDFFRVIWKEFRVSLIVGVVLAVANGLRIYLTYQQAGMAVVIALSLASPVCRCAAGRTGPPYRSNRVFRCRRLWCPIWERSTGPCPMCAIC